MTPNESFVGQTGTKSGRECNEGHVVRGECDDSIFLCLVQYWSGQGLTPEEAAAAAYKALEKLSDNPGGGTWCLLPEHK